MHSLVLIAHNLTYPIGARYLEALLHAKVVLKVANEGDGWEDLQPREEIYALVLVR